MNKVITRMNYMFNDKVCTEIEVCYKTKEVSIKNRTDKNLLKAFGVNERPTFADYEEFLESRCVPRTMGEIKAYLSSIGVQYYDPLAIIEKTKGCMAEDNFWIDIL